MNTAPTAASLPPARATDTSIAEPGTRAAPRRERKQWQFGWNLSWKQVWFQLHWLIGITAGSVLVIIGLSGATLAFKDEILDLMNPGVRHVAVEARAPLTPAQLSQIIENQHVQKVASVTMYAEPGAAPRLFFAPKEGQRRGESVYVHPYTGATQPALQGAAFFEWTESLHRWLLLPRDPGRKVAGALALCLLGLALSGLYLRWPRRPLHWRTWLTFDPALKGRSFLWNLHAVAGTWCLLVYLALTTTGIYWSYDVVRDNIDAWAGKPPREAPATAKKGPPKVKKAAPPVDVSVAWNAFQHQAGAWKLATVRMPTRAGEAVQVTWVAADAPHERARSSMSLMPEDGRVTKDERYAQQALGLRLTSIIYPLHMGTYFGLPGRIIMMLAALGLPLFAITGWMLYLGRRKAKRAVQAQRAMLGNMLGTTSPVLAATGMPTLVAYASQSGQAERLALESARALQQAGVPVDVRSLDQLMPAQLRAYEQAFIVASTFGEGEAPDGTRRFARLLQDAQASHTTLDGLAFGLLALGDRHYSQFCGFGHALDQQLRAMGATPLFPLIEVDKHDPAALTQWSQALAHCSGSAIDAIGMQEVASYATWRLTRRVLLNPGSQGGQLYEIAFSGPADATWEAGALAEIVPCNGDGSDSVPPHAPRSYSLASLPADSELQLLVRQERHAGENNGGYGVASGWLTHFAPIGSAVSLRLQANPAFAPALTDVPCIYIGNGSGLAGLRSHLRARRQAGLSRNWLLFGERQQAVDCVCSGELDGWLADGHLARLDRVYSRDAAPREYVQDRLRANATELRSWLEQGAIVYVCGSLQGMASGVDSVLLDVLGQEQLDTLMAEGRYRRDVY